MMKLERPKIRIDSIICLLVTIQMIMLSSCNHLFYQPDSQIYYTPEKIELKYRDIQIKVSPEVTLNGWVIPAVNPSKDRVAVMQFHGNAENRSTHFLSVAWLPEDGIDLIVFDYRGYDGSTGSPSREGVIDDGIAALKWFAQEFPNSRRYVIGQSLGGAIAVPSIAKAHVKLDGLVFESAFHSYRGIARMKLASSWMFWLFQWLPWIALSGNEDPVSYSQEINLPVLAFHDLSDPVVPYESGQILYNSFPPESTKIVSFKGRRHVGAFTDDRPESRSELLKFMKRSP